MHDIDRTQLEASPQFENFEFQQEQEQYEQFEFAGEQESYEFQGETYEVFNESEQMELAAELLEVRDEQELDRFLGNLIRRAASAVGQVIQSPVGQAVGGVLKGVAKKALPVAGGALGGYIGGPLGAKIGSGLATMAGSALGLEQETSYEDREFGGARQFVRLAGATVRNAVTSPSVNPRAAAQAAIAQAAQAYAPGLVQAGGQSSYGPRGGYGGSYGSPSVRGRSGRWLRRGSRIVLFGV